MIVEYDLTIVILIVITTGIIIGLFTYYLFYLTWWAAFTLGLIIAYILLNIMYPIGILMYQRNSYAIVVYIAIEILVPIYFLIYLLFTLLLTRRQPPLKERPELD